MSNVKDRANLIKSYQEVFKTEAGKEVILDLMEKGFILKPTYSNEDDRSCMLNEGRRELVLYILDICNYDLKQVYDTIAKYEKKQEENDEEIMLY